MKNRILTWLVLITFGLGLAVYAFAGIYGRMFTDDYCYSYSYQNLGLLGTLRGYYFILTFTAHRYALTFFEWVIDRFGLAGIQWMPAAFLALWGSAIYFLLAELNGFLRTRWKILQMAGVSAVLLFFTIYLAPNLYQSLYWRTGILPYTAPLIAGLWLVYYLFHSRSSGSAARYWLLGLGSFVAAGFSEAGALFIAGLFGLVILWSLIALLRKDHLPWETLGKPALPAVMAILIALVIMYLSPVNIQRQAGYQSPASPLMAIVFTFRFTFDFIWLSFRTQPLPNLVFCLMIAGYSFHLGPQLQWNFKRLGLTILAALVGMILIIAVIHLPSAYVEKSPPAERTLILTRFTLLAAELMISFLAGQWVTGFFHGRLPAVLAAAVVLLGCAYAVRVGINVIKTDYPRYQKVAQVWDQRDGVIREAKKNGGDFALVLPIDSQYIGGLLDFYPTPNWVNMCAAEFYGLDEIRAMQSW